VVERTNEVDVSVPVRSDTEELIINGVATQQLWEFLDDSDCHCRTGKCPSESRLSTYTVPFLLPPIKMNGCVVLLCVGSTRRAGRTNVEVSGFQRVLVVRDEVVEQVQVGIELQVCVAEIDTEIRSAVSGREIKYPASVGRDPCAALPYSAARSIACHVVQPLLAASVLAL